MQKKFLEHFPPPEYLDPSYVGIVFTENAVRILMLDKKNKHPIFFSDISLEPGIMELGKIKNEEALVKVLSEQRSNLKTPFVRFAIPDETSYVFTAKVPVVPGKGAGESIQFILEENVPLPLPDISFDFGIQSIERTDDSYSAEAAVVAASASLVASYENVLEKAGFEPLSCTSESEAATRAVVPEDRSAVSAIVHIHTQSAGIYISNGRLIEFSGIILIPSAESADVRSKSIADELLRTIDYWRTKARATLGKWPDLLSCYLCGESEILETLSLQLTQIPGIQPSIANVWQNAFSVERFVPEIPFEESLRFASAVGLLLDN